MSKPVIWRAFFFAPLNSGAFYLADLNVVGGSSRMILRMLQFSLRELR